jgi:hypothetical protein
MIIGSSHLHRAKRGSTRASREAAGRASNVVVSYYITPQGVKWRILTRADGIVTRELVSGGEQ